MNLRVESFSFAESVVLGALRAASVAPASSAGPSFSMGMPPAAEPPSFCSISTYFFIASDGPWTSFGFFLRFFSNPPPPSACKHAHSQRPTTRGIIATRERFGDLSIERSGVRVRTQLRPSALASSMASALTLEYLKRWNHPIP